MRKIIQIAVTPETEECFGYLYALCSDGTVWFRSTSGNGTNWLQMPDLPQEPVKVGSFTFTEYGDGR